MILIWSVVVLFVILGGWFWWKHSIWKVGFNAHMDLLPELRERLEQPHVDYDGRPWTNVATFEIWDAFVLNWEGCTDELTYILSEGDSFEELFSVDYLRSTELEDFLHFNNEDRTWDLGESTYDLQIYRDLWDYDQLSERLVEWFKNTNTYPDGLKGY